MIDPKVLYSANIEKINELQPHVRWAAMRFMDSCWQRGWYFSISESFRTQARQNQLYNQGRLNKLPVVTWTRMSLHTQRLAMDIYPIGNTRYTDLIDAALVFGITHPLKKLDLPHFELSEVKAEIPKPSIEQLEHAIAKAEPPRLNALQIAFRAAKRKLQRLSS